MSLFSLLKSFATLSLLLLPGIAAAVLKPAPGSSPALTNDTFITYQWPLKNNGQTVISDLDDTHPITTTGHPKIQIGWKNYDSQMKREILVAVLDSGLDSSHPELKDRFVPGFNFTVKDPRKEKIFDDDIGHGTHIAGILAAISNNNQGISGLSGKIKILPLKVYDGKEDTGAGSKRIPISERVAQAIEMALAKKADLIHLSMGWPRIANTATVEAAFKKALASGTLIVAAAGNDHHQAQIYPCAYPGVICVASVDINGELSNFSNFGGHVDIAAPGQEILSLWPQLKTSSHFGPKGYELKSGTSQAAPFVTGALAILKGIHPNESSQQLRSRLLLGAEALPGHPSLGLVNIEKSLASDPRFFSAPVFKGIEMAEVDPRSLQFEFPLRIEKNQVASTVRVMTTQKNITLSAPSLVSDRAGEMLFRVRGRLSTLSADNRLSYTVIVNGRQFHHQILMAVPLASMNAMTISWPRGELIAKNDLRSVPDPRHGSVTRYWTSEQLPGPTALRVYLWTLMNGRADEMHVDLSQISELQSGFNILAEDWNMDGQTDFIIAGLSKDAQGQPQEVVFYYLDSNFNIIHRFPLKYEGVLPTFQSAKDLMFGRMTIPAIGTVKVPVFWDTGLIPEKDLNPNAFAFEQNISSRRLYYLQPTLENGNRWQMITRTLTASLLDQQLRARLDLDATQDVEGLGTKIQSLPNLSRGQVELLVSVGRGVRSTTYNLIFPDLTNPFQSLVLEPIAKSSFDLSKNQIKEALNLSTSQVHSETDFQAVFSPMAARSVLMRSQSFLGNTLALPQRGEQIIGIIKSFVRNNDVATFFETTDWLRIQGRWDSLPVNDKVQVFRSSFLPGSLFTQLFVPVIVTPQRQPGVLFDNSQLFSSSVIVSSVNRNGRLSSPVGRTLSLPKHCLGRAPVLNSTGFTRLSFLCGEGSRYEMKFLDLN